MKFGLLPRRVRTRRILKLALPIMGGMLSQSLLNLVDAALVGTLGEIALAGVGVGGYAMFIATALVMGLSSGVQSQVARRYGARHFNSILAPLNAGLMIAVAITLPLMFIGHQEASLITGWISQNHAVQHVSADYFAIRILTLLPIALNLCFRGYWNGIHQSGTYFKIILMMHALNIPLSIWLIYGGAGIPALGAEGAALGTTISVWIGALTWSVTTWRHTRQPNTIQWAPEKRLLWRVISLATPNSFQQLMFAMGYAVLFWILGHIDAASVAVGHVLVNLSLLLILPGVGLGMAATTLVGNAIGAQQLNEAHRWGWDVVRVAFFTLTLLALPMLLVPDMMLSLFLHQQALIDLGRLPLQLTGVMIALDAAAIVLNQALLGAGAHRRVMQLQLITQWLCFLPAAWWVGLHLGYGLEGIWWTQLGYRLLNSALFALIWQQKRWLRPA